MHVCAFLQEGEIKQSMSAMLSAQHEMQRSLISLESGEVTSLREQVHGLTQKWTQTKQRLDKKQEELEKLQQLKAAHDKKSEDELRQVNSYTEKLLQVVMEKNPELLGFL